PIGPTSTTRPMVPAMGEALVISGPEGIRLVGLDGTTLVLASDPLYEAITWAVSDGEGGLVFQHDVTPLPWDQGTILALAAGTTEPRVLVAPPPGGYLRPLAIDSGLLLYRVDLENRSEVRTLDAESRVSTVVVPATELLIGAATAGGRVVAGFGGECPRLAWYALDGSPLARPSWDTDDCRPGPMVDLAFTGNALYLLEDRDSRRLVRLDFATGETVDVAASEAWAVAALPDGTVALGGSQISVGRIGAAGFVETFRTANATSFSLAVVGALSTAATLGSGSGDLPCTPLEVGDPPPQNLPPAVGDRRVELFRMAAACDLAGLAARATAHHTSFSFGGETDPLRSWIRSARHGFDVMSWMVRILNTTPAVDAVGTYVWPAVHATNSEGDWQEMSAILSAAEFDQYYPHRDRGWLGLRIGIAPDGTWRFAVAGD
ncbi:MAG TPA: hypothetical protein VLA54_06225, partial [Acidimicrobiia bacterium]|nr:hypothetical protein [Acidimicrobiia bacterium]